MIDARLFDKLVGASSPKKDESNIDAENQEYLARRIRNKPRPFGGIQVCSMPSSSIEWPLTSNVSYD